MGLGDIAVPGLLAALALRYDASRAINMQARGFAAATAMQEAIDSLLPGASDDEIAKLTGSAAERAYDAVADLELEQRDRTQGSSTSGSADTIYAASESVQCNELYFVSCMVAYVAGLGIAFAANAITHSGNQHCCICVL